MKQKRTVNSAILMVLGLTAITAASAVMAQVELETEERKLEEVTVTAQKREQSITDVPMSISVLTAENMTEMGINDISDIAKWVPNFNASETAFGPPVYTMRGVGFNESSPQATSTVGIYVDQIAVPYPIMTKGINLDLERVEILKGPQGTLYGRNATAGAVNYITAKPTKEFEASILASYGSFQTYSVEGFASGGLTENILARLAVRTVQSNKGWQESISRDERLGEQDKVAARLSFAFLLGADTDILFKIAYNKDKSDSIAPQAMEYIPGKAGGLPFAASITAPVYSNPDLLVGNGNDNQAADWTQGRHPRVNHKNTGFSLDLTHAFTDTLILTSLTGYSKFKDNGSQYERGGVQGITAGEIRNTQNALTAIVAGIFGLPPDTPGMWSGFLRGPYADAPDSEYVTADYVFQNGKINSFSQELRIAQTLDKVIWMAGLYYSDSKVQYSTVQDWGVSSNVNILPTMVHGFNFIDNAITQKSKTKAVFVNADWLLTDQWTITTGLRYSKDKATYAGCSKDVDGGVAGTFANFFGSPVVPGECATILDFGGPDQRSGLLEDELNENSTSWRLAANYEMNQDVSFYASYSRGFKSGSFPSLAALADVQLIPVVQERLDAYEIGTKLDFADGAAHLNVAAFYYDYKDKQLLTKAPVPVFGTAFTLANVPKSRVSGIEADLQWLPTDGLLISAAVGYLDSKIKEGTEFNQVGEYIDLEGSRLPYAPKFQANFSAMYEWGLSNNLMGMVAFDLAYTSNLYYDFKSRKDMTEPLENPFGENIPPMPYSFNDDFYGGSNTLLGARIGVFESGGQWRVYLWGRNLTNETYATTTVKNNEMISRYVGMPRSFGATFEYNWF